MDFAVFLRGKALEKPGTAQGDRVLGLPCPREEPGLMSAVLRDAADSSVNLGLEQMLPGNLLALTPGVLPGL